jgi:hypothetical protein
MLDAFRFKRRLAWLASAPNQKARFSFWKKRLAALKIDSRAIDAGRRSVIGALENFKGEGCCRLVSRDDPRSTPDHEEVHSKGHPCYRVGRTLAVRGLGGIER